MVAGQDPDQLPGKLIELSERIDFGHRYYERRTSLRARSGYREYRAGGREIEALLAESSFDFRSREKFLEHTETCAGHEVVLRVSFRNSVAEFILYVSVGGLIAGGPYPIIALDVIQSREPDFTPTPLAPKLPFSNEEELRECVQFGVTLFTDVREGLAGRPDRAAAPESRSG